MKSIYLSITLLVLVVLVHAPFSYAGTPINTAGSAPSSNINLNSDNFKLSVCDGPKGLPGVTDANDCDFNALMEQIKVAINVAIVLGVLIAIAGFTYAGYLYITGVPSNIEHAHSIFKNVIIGFVIMLSAWFIVYQILLWLTGDSVFTTLLGK